MRAAKKQAANRDEVTHTVNIKGESKTTRPQLVVRGFGALTIKNVTVNDCEYGYIAR